MSGDELFALILFGACGLFGWLPWILSGLSRDFPSGHGIGMVTAGAPLIALAAMFLILRLWSAHDVRDSTLYMSFYLVMWFGWTGVLNRILPFVGLSHRDDVIERCNPAAAVAVSGALIGCTLAFAGGNIGDGPGWWVVVFSSGLATLTLILLWLFGNLITHVAEAITVDRDVAAGWRTLGFFIGGGFITGRAAAGNWVSAAGTINDFVAKGWMILLLWCGAVCLDKLLRPTPIRPTPPVVSCGWFPAFIYIVAGFAVALMQGRW